MAKLNKITRRGGRNKVLACCDPIGVMVGRAGERYVDLLGRINIIHSAHNYQLELTPHEVRRLLFADRAQIAAERLTPEEWGTLVRLTSKLLGIAPPPTERDANV